MKTRVLLLWLVLGVSVVGPLGFGHMIWQRLPEPDLREFVEPVPVLVDPQTVEDDLSAEVVLRPDWLEGEVPTAPLGGGIVTSVYFEGDGRIANGDVLYGVDRGTVMALETDAPLVRQLRLGSKGPDVLEVRRAYSALGHEVDLEIPVVDRALVRLFEEDRVARGLPLEGVFDPAYTVWLEQDRAVVGGSLLSVGSPAPALGAPLFEATATLSTLQVLQESSDGRLVDVQLDPSERWQLVIDDQVFGLDSVLEKEARTLAAIAPVIQGLDDDSLAGHVSLVAVRRFSTLPATAIIEDGDMTCVENADGSLEPVQIIGGSIGIVTIDKVLTDRVVANPNVLSSHPRQCR